MDDLAFCATRHRFLDGSFTGNSASLSDWRLRTRMRTVGAALVVCLNIGVDPPDVLKTDPCARTEAWMDPMTLPPQKALSSIGNRLQKQYERWQPRALYKLALDQTDEELRNLCISLRRAARSERALFHFNGHGVPRPTANGEIWVFNKNYTQYIPISLYDLNSWLGAPAIYVFDCSGAGILLEALQQIRRNAGQQGETEEEAEEIIALAACAENQLLPMNPDLPADLFTSCLTTPIKMALKWFASRSMLCQVSSDQVDKLPGRPNDRKSPFGELNWIFTAVTDTIAWNVLPPRKRSFIS